MHVEAPGVEVGARVALVLPETAAVLDGVSAVPPAGDRQGVEIPDRNLVDLLIVELMQLIHFAQPVILGPDPQRAV